MADRIPRTGPVTGYSKGSITADVIRRIEPTGKRFTLRDTQQPGLQLVVGMGGSKIWYLDYRDRNNKRQSFRIGTTKTYSASEARSEAKRLAGQLAEGVDPALEKRKAKAQATREAEQAQEVAGRTLEVYLETIYRPQVLRHTKGAAGTEAAIKHVFEDFLSRDMATLTVDEMERHNTTRLEKGRSPQTLNRDRTRLMALLNHAAKHGVLDKNPLARWEKVPEVDDKRVRWLGQLDDMENYPQGERDRFMAALEHQAHDFQIIVLMALHTGMRRGELFSLTWRKVDLVRRTVTVAAATAKSSKSRTIPLNSTIFASLLEWRGNVLHLNPDALAFPSPRTGARRENIKRPWDSLVAEANLDDFHFHDCRHDFASRLVQAGVSLYQVSEYLGHSGIELTQRYAHLKPADAAEAVEVLVTKR